ncbi:MAG TPA: hypothetical protein VFW33_09845 [Gemmataceae bacterium]|nr:hypothetical protein [Gemmataceae bacterium]
MSSETVAHHSAGGRPLADAAADYRRSPSALGLHDLLRPFVAACYQVAAAHGRGENHLGLTPRRILLGEHAHTTVVGWDGPPPADAYAAAFLAPEQVASPAEKVGPAADVYALGAVLYALLTGQPPYLGETAAEVLARVREGLPWQPRMVAGGVPAALEAVCLTAMERDAADRYASAADLAREVERWMAGRRVSTNYAEPKGVRLVAWLRTRYGLLTLVLLTALSLLGLAYAAAFDYVERRKNREDARRLEETIRDKVAQITRQRSLSSDEFAAAVRTLGELARQAQAHAGGESPTGFREEVLRQVHESARRMAAYADQAAGNDLAAAHDRIGLAELFLALGRPDEAARQYEWAVLITRAITAAQPDSAPAKTGLFQSALGLGHTQMLLHNPAVARQIAGIALAVAEERAAADSNGVPLRRDVARCHELTAEADVALHDLPAARAAAEKLLTTIEGYANADPNDVTGRIELAHAYLERGRVERLAYDFAAAAPWYDRALAILRPLKAAGKLAAYPQEPARLEEAERAAAECRDIVKAVEDVNFALKERGGETRRRLLVGRAAALAHLGRPADAAGTAEMVRALKPEDGANLYDVACCYALCVPVAKDKAARDEYVTHAVAELRAAAAHGYDDLTKIEADPDLDALHGEAGYRAFVAGLKVRRMALTLPMLP